LSCGGNVASTFRQADASSGPSDSGASDGDAGDGRSPFDLDGQSGSSCPCTTSQYCYMNVYLPTHLGHPWDPLDGAADDADAADDAPPDGPPPWDGGVYPDGCHAYDPACVSQPTCGCELAVLSGTCGGGPPQCMMDAAGRLFFTCIAGGGR
jgi:hypothetical protein